MSHGATFCPICAETPLDRMIAEDEWRPARDHPATPGFIVSSLPKVERCVTCGRYLRRSKTSPTGWRHSGLRP